jgi:hypothetical protein
MGAAGASVEDDAGWELRALVVLVAVESVGGDGRVEVEVDG